jgi:hypothetical protein
MFLLALCSYSCSSFRPLHSLFFFFLNLILLLLFSHVRYNSRSCFETVMMPNASYCVLLEFNSGILSLNPSFKETCMPRSLMSFRVPGEGCGCRLDLCTELLWNRTNSWSKVSLKSSIISIEFSGFWTSFNIL